jgi:hypothetical protein
MKRLPWQPDIDHAPNANENDSISFEKSGQKQIRKQLAHLGLPQPL